MPTYVYACRHGHETEIVHQMTQVVGVWCVCGERMRRKILPIPFSIRRPHGLERTMEIHSDLKGKYHANKARRESNEEQSRYAREGHASTGA